MRKLITFFGQQTVLACDGRCDKAWGMNGRPRKMLSEDDPDDYVYEPDGTLGTAPAPGLTRGISEGGDMKPSAKPLSDPERMNRWCARECERSRLFRPGERESLPDFGAPVPNKRSLE